MNGQQRLRHVAISEPAMEMAMPGMPMTGTTMIRVLRITQSVLGGYFEPVFRDLELTENKFHVLCLLLASPNGAAAPSELSDMVGTSRGNMTRILADLTEEGWIERKAAKRDARRQDISITAAGRRKVRDTVPRIDGPIVHAFSDLTDAEMGQLSQLLKKLVVSLDKGALGASLAA